MLNKGEVVLYTDQKGQQFPALVTQVWTETCVNVVYVSGTEGKQDDYGQQLERANSVTRKSGQSAPGYFYEEIDSLKLLKL